MNLMLDIPRFMFADIANATSADPNNVKAWIVRGVATLGEYDREPVGTGSRAMYTLRTAYEFGIAANLVGLGLTPAMGFTCARHFTRGDEAGRDPETLLCERGQTLLLVWKGPGQIKEFDPAETYSNMIEIYNVDPKNSADWFDVIFKNQACAATVIHVNPILAAVDRALDVRRPEKAASTKSSTKSATKGRAA